jgi:hypothetical protein
MTGRLIIKRKPGGGRKRKIDAKGIADILASKELPKVKAKQYGVHVSAIYLIFKKERIKHMNIPIEPEHEDLHEATNVYELCVFCNRETRFWNIQTNRPVCPVCSVVYSPADISKAPYGY